MKFYVLLGRQKLASMPAAGTGGTSAVGDAGAAGGKAEEPKGKEFVFNILLINVIVKKPTLQLYLVYYL